MAVQQDVSLFHLRAVGCVEHMAVGCPHHPLIQPEGRIVRQNRELQYHLVYLAVAVSADAQQLLLHPIKHFDDLFRSVVLWQVVAWAVIQNISQHQQLSCLFLTVALQQPFTPVCGPMQVRSNHPLHIFLSSILCFAGKRPAIRFALYAAGYQSAPAAAPAEP